MAQIKLDLDTETFSRLVASALDERRPIPWQAEVILRRALGLPFPPILPMQEGAHGCDRKEAAHANTE